MYDQLPRHTHTHIQTPQSTAAKGIKKSHYLAYSSSVSFATCPVLKISHHHIQTLTWGLQKDILRAIPTQVLAKQKLCHIPAPIIPTAIYHASTLFSAC